MILYFHGGGYVSGTCNSHRAITAKFVKGSRIGALLFEYRLAPEHPYPAALEDSLQAYHWLIKQNVAPDQIAFVGDSAGGGLCLAALLALRDQGAPLPAAAVAYSPVTDLTCSGESYRTKAKACLSPAGMAAALAKHYAGSTDCTLPYISPLYGELQELPPLLIYAGEDETLRDDSVYFAAKAKAAGVDVTLRIGEGMFLVIRPWRLFFRRLPGRCRKFAILSKVTWTGDWQAGADAYGVIAVNSKTEMTPSLGVISVFNSFGRSLQKR